MKRAIELHTVQSGFTNLNHKVHFHNVVRPRSPRTTRSSLQIILNLETALEKSHSQLIPSENRGTNKESEKRGQHSLIM